MINDRARRAEWRKGIAIFLPKFFEDIESLGDIPKTRTYVQPCAISSPQFVLDVDRRDTPRVIRGSTALDAASPSCAWPIPDRFYCGTCDCPISLFISAYPSPHLVSAPVYTLSLFALRRSCIGLSDNEYT